MKGKLIKQETHYHLAFDKEIVGSTHKIIADKYKLSLKNCEAIERGYDLDEMACKEIKIDISVVNHIDRKLNETLSPCVPLNEGGCVGSNLYNQVKGFQKGFQKALEILGDKKFSEEDMISFGLFCINNIDAFNDVDDLFKKWKSLQQTEWDVEIEMDILNEYNQPKLDADGCLILKRVV